MAAEGRLWRVKAPRHAEDPDTAEQQDHETGEAQVVLTAADAPGEAVSRLPERPHPDGLVLEGRAETGREPADRLLVRHREQHLPAGALRDVEQPGRLQVGERHQHPRPAPEEVDPRPRLREQVAAHLEGFAAKDDRVPDLEAEPDPDFGPDQRPPPAEQFRTEGGSGHLKVAVEREGAVHPLQFDHRAPERVVGRARERRDLHRARTRR